MSVAQKLMKKWEPVIEAKEAPAINDSYKKQVLAVILENQERETAGMNESAMLLNENLPANSVSGGGVAGWNPILISLVRRSMPNLMAYDVCSVQPMSGPTGLIFALRSRYTSQSGAEAFYNEADTDFSGTGVHGGDPSTHGTDTGTADTTLTGYATGDTVADSFSVGQGLTTAQGETLGDSGGITMNEMAVSIERATVTARERGLRAEYTWEIAQDLKALHGLDAESELANMLTGEILADINREIVRKINLKAKLGAQTSNVATAGTFNLDTDASGRWSVEKFKGLLLQIEFECNQIAKDTRRGKGNFLICSSNVASVLAAAGVMDYAPEMKTNGLTIDDTGNTFAGTINGKIKVYIDPYATTTDYVTVGYRGNNAYDAGLFYCPYVPLTMGRTMQPGNLHPIIGFKTRYGLVAHPFAEGTTAAQNDEGNNRANVYYRTFRVTNLL